MFLVAVILLAIVVGYIRKGNLSNAVKAEIRVPYLFVLALLLFLVVEAGNAAGWDVVVDYSIWIRFLAHFTLITSIFVNIQTLDIWPLAILIGSVMNFTAIFSNVGRMPVSARALEIAGIETAVIEASNYFELAGASTSFSFLGGVIPIPLPGIFAQVISIGTLIIAFGAFGFIQELMLGIEYVDEDDDLEFSDETLNELDSEDVTVESVGNVVPVNGAKEEEIQQLSSGEESEDDIKSAILGVVESTDDDEYDDDLDDDYEDDIDDYDDYDGYFDDEPEYDDEKFDDLFKALDEQLAVMGNIDEVSSVDDSAPEAIDDLDTADTYLSDDIGTADDIDSRDTEEQPEEIIDDTVNEDKQVEKQEDGAVSIVETEEEETARDNEEPYDEIEVLIEGLSSGNFDDSMFSEDIFTGFEEIYVEDIEPGDTCETEDIENVSVEEDADIFDIVDDAEVELIENIEEILSEEVKNVIVTGDEFVNDEITDASNESEDPVDEVVVSGEFSSGEDSLPVEEVSVENYLETETESIDEDISLVADTDETVEDVISDGIQEALADEPEYIRSAAEFIEDAVLTDVYDRNKEQEFIDIEDIFGEDSVEEPEFIIEGLDDFEDIYSIVGEEDDALSSQFNELFAETEDDSYIELSHEEPMKLIDDFANVDVAENAMSDESGFVVSDQSDDIRSAEATDVSSESDIDDEDLEAIFRAILSTDDEPVSETILSSGDDENLMESTVALEYANAASFFEDLDRNESKEDAVEDNDLFDKFLDSDTEDEVAVLVEEVVEQIKADEQVDAFDVLKSVGETVEPVSNELLIESQLQEQQVLTRTDSQYIVVDGKIVANPNYKLRRSSKTRFATEEEKLFGDISSGRRRNKGSNKGKFSVKDDE